MARRSASQALESYRSKYIGDLSRQLDSSVKRRRAELDAATFADPEEQEEPPKASEILQEYKAVDELRERQLAKNEMQKYNIGGSVDSYLEEKDRSVTRSKELLKLQDGIVKQRNVDMKALSKDPDIVEAEQKALFQRGIRDIKSEKGKSESIGSEYEKFSLRDFDIDNTPKTKLTIKNAQDIPYRSYDSAGGDYSDGNFYVTNSTVTDIMENGNYIEKYDLSDKLKDLFSPFFVSSKTGDTTQTSIVPQNTVEYEKAVQDFIFEIAKKDADFRNFYKIDIKDEPLKDLVKKGYAEFDIDGKTYKVKQNRMGPYRNE